MFTKTQTGQLQEPEVVKDDQNLLSCSKFIHFLSLILKSLLLITADLGVLKLFSVETIEYSQFLYSRFLLMRASLIS